MYYMYYDDDGKAHMSHRESDTESNYESEPEPSVLENRKFESQQPENPMLQELIMLQKEVMELLKLKLKSTKMD